MSNFGGKKQTSGIHFRNNKREKKKDKSILDKNLQLLFNNQNAIFEQENSLNWIGRTLNSVERVKISKAIQINTAYCDKFFSNKPRNLLWNDIDYILYNVVQRAIATRFDLAQGSHQTTHTKKKHYSTKQKLTLSSSLHPHRDCTAKYSVKVPAAQFRIAYCPTLKGLGIHTHKKKTLHYTAKINIVI